MVLLMSQNSGFDFFHISIWQAFFFHWWSWIWFSVTPSPCSSLLFPGWVLLSYHQLCTKEAFSVHSWNAVEDFVSTTHTALFIGDACWVLAPKDFSELLGYFAFMHIVDFVSDQVSFLFRWIDIYMFRAKFVASLLQVAIWGHVPALPSVPVIWFLCIFLFFS